MFDLSGKIALVTGASGSLGSAISVALAEAGADVACHYHTRQESAERVAARVRELGRRSIVLAADLSNPSEADRMVDETIEKLGDLHILVNVAGINRETLLVRQTPDLVQDVINCNLASMLYVARAASRKMAKNRYGRLIHISSVVAHTGSTAQVVYAASKAGIEGMSRAIAREMGGRNITSNVVAPGFLEGGMSDKMSDERKAELKGYIALGRAGKIEEITPAVVFLAGDEAAYITGAIIHVNGGMFMQ
jgi:3-oxoacyl-[acyl-carrier protein] reductase